jgi:hypothetical protein
MASLALLLLASPATAETVTFIGTTSGGIGNAAVLSGQAFSLTLSYTPNGASTFADVTGGSLTIGTDTFSFLNSGTRRMTIVEGGATDNVQTQARFGLGSLPNDPNSVFNAAEIDGLVSGNANVPLLASAANLSALLQYPNAYNGTFTLYGDAAHSVSLSGMVAAPEPGSVALLSGLALVSGRRMWRRRQQKKAAAVNAT